MFNFIVIQFIISFTNTFSGVYHRQPEFSNAYIAEGKSGNTDVGVAHHLAGSEREDTQI